MRRERLVHRFKQFGRALEAVLGVLCYHLHDDCRGRGGDIGIDLPRIGNGIREQLVKNLVRVMAGIRVLARQHFIERGAEAVDIRAGVDALGVLGLFRRKVCRRADHHVGSGQLIVHFLVFGDAQIRELDFPLFREHDVVRLDVAVDDTEAFRCAQGGRNGFDDDNGLFLRKRLCGFQDASQTAAVDILHDDIRATELGICFDVHDTDYVGVADFRGEFRLADEAFQEFIVVLQKLPRKDFQRAVCAQRLVLGQINLAHAAFPDPFDDDVFSDLASGNKDRLRRRHARRQRRRTPGRRGRRRGNGGMLSPARDHRLFKIAVVGGDRVAGFLVGRNLSGNRIGHHGHGRDVDVFLFVHGDRKEIQDDDRSRHVQRYLGDRHHRLPCLFVYVVAGMENVHANLTVADLDDVAR